MLSAMAFGSERIDSLILNSWPVQAAGGAFIAALVGLIFQVVTSYKRIAWRAYVDKPINLDPAQARSMRQKLKFKVYIEDIDRGSAESEVKSPWLVLLRVRNSGLRPIHGKDFNTPLTFIFPGREVRAVDVIDHSGESADMILPAPRRREVNPHPHPERLGAAQRLWVLVTGLPAESEPLPDGKDGKKSKKAHVAEIALSDKFLLNRKDRFTLRVVLSGEPDKKRKRIEYLGKFAGGKVVPEPPRLGPGNRRMFFGAITTLALAGLLAGLFVAPPAGPGGSACTGGRLQLEGSTAFAPTAQLIAGQYKSACRGARITVGTPNAGTGSVSGLNALTSAGPAAAGSQIAMSDGPAPAGAHYAGLSGTAVGVISFAVVVNRKTGVYNLTSGQIAQIFSGAITNWSQIPGGADEPVRIVSRDPGSGTRRAFDQYVLRGAPEPGASSFDCTDKDLTPGAKVTLCEEASTGALLQEVAQVPGAIGYAETAAADTYPGHAIESVELDGVQDTFGQLGTRPGTYPFWTVEYLYTYGNPPARSLAAAFLGYLGDGTVKNLLSAQGITPCAGQRESQILAALCAPGAR